MWACVEDTDPFSACGGNGYRTPILDPYQSMEAIMYHVREVPAPSDELKDVGEHDR